MARSALRPAKSVAQLLRERRNQQGMTLRQVSEEIASRGEPLPPSTLARIEQGKLDPGVRRLHLLLRLYDIDAEQVADMIELETGGVELPQHGDLAILLADAKKAWRAGRPQEAMAHCLAAMACPSDDAESRRMRQDAGIGLGYALRDRSRITTARRVVDQLLTEELAPDLKHQVYLLSAILYYRQGAYEMAKVVASFAETTVRPGDHGGYASIFHQRASWAGNEGEFDAAEEQIEHALRHLRELDGTESRQARAWLLRGKLKMRQSHYAAGRDAFLEAGRLVESTGGFEHYRSSCEVQLAWALTELGEIDEALRLLRSARALAVEQENPSGEFDALHRMWKAYQRAGDTNRAAMALKGARLLVSTVEEESDEVAEVLAAQS